MSLLDHVREHEALGSWPVRFGIAKAPDGYAVMYDGESHHYWLRDDGAESCIHWNKWAVLKWARHDAAKRVSGTNGGTAP